MARLKYYNANEEELSYEVLKNFYEDGKLLIISGLTNSGKETLAKIMSNDSSYATILMNSDLYNFNNNKIGLIHAGSIEVANRVLTEALKTKINAKHIYIEKKAGKYILDMQIKINE